MLDPYASCPCGSGKKFKWCCQAIYPGIQQALEQDQAGQHDAALRIIDDVVKANESNPEAWGQKARLQYMQGKVDEAEETLEKAFALNPKYPYGLFLRANMRFNEGEIQGALLLARRAADVFDPDAKDILAGLYSMIFDAEMRHNRPVAARAALEHVVALAPGDENSRNAIPEVFGDTSRLPLAARKKYELIKPDPSRRAAWNAALHGVPARFAALAATYEALTAQAADDAPAWYNLGLAKAWLGDNKGAIAALDAYIEKCADEQAAADAATLAEVLRCGQGMDDESDYVEQVMTYQLRDPQPVNALLQEWVQSRRLVPLPNDQEGLLTALILELTTTGLVTVGSPAAEGGRLAGYLVIAGPSLRLQCPVPETFPRLKDEIRTKLGLGLTDLKTARIPPNFPDIVAEALLFPVGPVSEGQAEQKALDHAGRFFEDTWVNRPRKSLSNMAPSAAVGSTKLRRKTRGIVEFLRQCAAGGMLATYDFGRILKKLGVGDPASAPAAAPA
ncbi:MAG: tetratricopeptide repeat protein, partial [Gemmataceae bacterium]